MCLLDQSTDSAFLMQLHLFKMQLPKKTNCTELVFSFHEYYSYHPTKSSVMNTWNPSDYSFHRYHNSSHLLCTSLRVSSLRVRTRRGPCSDRTCACDSEWRAPAREDDYGREEGTVEWHSYDFHDQEMLIKSFIFFCSGKQIFTDFASFIWNMWLLWNPSVASPNPMNLYYVFTDLEEFRFVFDTRIIARVTSDVSSSIHAEDCVRDQLKWAIFSYFFIPSFSSALTARVAHFFLLAIIKWLTNSTKIANL